MALLRQREGTAARPLEFAILTATRTGRRSELGGRKSTCWQASGRCRLSV
jgi:hypothetical protein